MITVKFQLKHIKPAHYMFVVNCTAGCVQVNDGHAQLLHNTQEDVINIINVARQRFYFLRKSNNVQRTMNYNGKTLISPWLCPWAVPLRVTRRDGGARIKQVHDEAHKKYIYYLRGLCRASCVTFIRNANCTLQPAEWKTKYVLWNILYHGRA